jgi:type I restriction enzyme S subunit
MCVIVAPQVDPTLAEYRDLPHVSGENIESATGRLKYLNTASEDRMTSGKYLFDPGDVLYSKLRPYLRKVTLIDFKGLCSADMYPLKVNPDLLDPAFTVWMLLSNEFTIYANEESQRSRMPKLNREQLFGWPAPLIPLDKQKEFGIYLKEKMREIDKLIKRLEGQLDAINELPGSLLHQAFNGEL